MNLVDIVRKHYPEAWILKVDASTILFKKFFSFMSIEYLGIYCKDKNCLEVYNEEGLLEEVLY